MRRWRWIAPVRRPDQQATAHRQVHGHSETLCGRAVTLTWIDLSGWLDPEAEQIPAHPVCTSCQAVAARARRAAQQPINEST